VNDFVSDETEVTGRKEHVGWVESCEGILGKSELLKGNRKLGLKQIQLEERPLQYQQWKLWTWQLVINFLKHSYITNKFLTVSYFCIHPNYITVPFTVLQPLSIPYRSTV
jgi:hypothetical protein